MRFDSNHLLAVMDTHINILVRNLSSKYFILGHIHPLITENIRDRNALAIVVDMSKSVNSYAAKWMQFAYVGLQFNMAYSNLIRSRHTW